VLYNSGGEVVLDVRRGGAGRVVRVNIDLRVYELGALGDFTPQGMRIRIVAPGTAAERVGLQPGDLLVQIDGRPIRTQNDFRAALKTSAGTVVLGVRKAPTGVPVRIPVELINNPLGAWCEPATEGLRIVSIPLGTPAEQLGLERGDIIVKVDNQRIRTNRDLTTALNNSGGVATLIVRQGSTGRLVSVEALLGY